MSSLTSPSVNKNITRFAPKVKHRDQRRSSLKSSHLPTSGRTTISTSSFTSQSLADSDSSTAKITEPVSSTSSLPSIQSQTNSSNSIPPPEPTTSKTAATTQSMPIPKPRSRRISSTSSNTFQPPSKGDHIVVIAPPSPDQEENPTFNTTLPTTPSPILHDNDDTTTDTHSLHPLSKKRKRNTPSRRNANHGTEQVESLVTLDDITHDPAEPSLMQKPLSYFTDDLSTGVVSRSFKENERRRAIAAAATGLIKKPIDNNNKSANSIEMLDEADNINELTGLQDSASAPQVRLVDGEIVLDTASLYIDRPLGQRKQVDYEVVEEDNTSKRINSHTHGKQHGTHGKRWTKDESDLFYQGLTQHGTDFEMISTMIPNRTRKEIKLMFNRQEKVCPWKVTASIMKNPNSSHMQEQTTE
ncbi:hypothetical protein BCR42DRAFT_423365 [Absidia repens]|uniref:SANT domain-containing protein n=1 Tax=Absidia repens TaxID=90262 RepID=A0A1X2I791_9FUNG|nr:hypothetical protein BCR42DRAFT_423365 [Absidia repens]